MTKAELEKRVAELEAQVAALSAHVCPVPPAPSCNCGSTFTGTMACPVHPPWGGFKITCGAAAGFNPALTQHIDINGANAVPYEGGLNMALNTACAAPANTYRVTVP